MDESMARGEFFRYQYQPVLTGVSAGRQFMVPPVALVGWIPSVNGPAPPQLAAGLLSPSAQDALTTLLTTGNDPPPNSFLGPGDFVGYLQRKDFRAALALDEIKIVTDRAGAFASVVVLSPHSLRLYTSTTGPEDVLLAWSRVRKAESDNHP